MISLMFFALVLFGIYSTAKLEQKLNKAKEALERIKNIKAKDVVKQPEAVVYKCQSIASEALTTLSHD